MYHHEGCWVPWEMATLWRNVPFPKDQWSSPTHCLPPPYCLSLCDTRVNAPGTWALSGRVHSAGPAHVHSWDDIKSQQSDPWVMNERRRKREEEGASLLKDPLNLLRCTAWLPSTLCHYKLEVSGALSGVVLAHLQRFLFNFCGKEKSYSSCSV